MNDNRANRNVRAQGPLPTLSGGPEAVVTYLGDLPKEDRHPDSYWIDAYHAFSTVISRAESPEDLAAAVTVFESVLPASGDMNRWGIEGLFTRLTARASELQAGGGLDVVPSELAASLEPCADTLEASQILIEEASKRGSRARSIASYISMSTGTFQPDSGEHIAGIILDARNGYRSKDKNKKLANQNGDQRYLTTAAYKELAHLTGVVLPKKPMVGDRLHAMDALMWGSMRILYKQGYPVASQLLAARDRMRPTSKITGARPYVLANNLHIANLVTDQLNRHRLLPQEVGEEYKELERLDGSDFRLMPAAFRRILWAVDSHLLDGEREPLTLDLLKDAARGKESASSAVWPAYMRYMDALAQSWADRQTVVELSIGDLVMELISSGVKPEAVGKILSLAEGGNAAAYHKLRTVHGVRRNTAHFNKWKPGSGLIS